MIPKKKDARFAVNRRTGRKSRGGSTANNPLRSRELTARITARAEAESRRSLHKAPAIGTISKTGGER